MPTGLFGPAAKNECGVAFDSIIQNAFVVTKDRQDRDAVNFPYPDGRGSLVVPGVIRICYKLIVFVNEKEPFRGVDINNTVGECGIRRHETFVQIFDFKGQYICTFTVSPGLSSSRFIGEI